MKGIKYNSLDDIGEDRLHILSPLVSALAYCTGTTEKGKKHGCLKCPGMYDIGSNGMSREENYQNVLETMSRMGIDYRNVIVDLGNGCTTRLGENVDDYCVSATALISTIDDMLLRRE